MQQRGSYLLVVPGWGLLLATVIAPLLLLLRVSLYAPTQGRGFYTPGTWTLANFPLDQAGLTLTGFTLGFGLVVAFLTLLLAYPLAEYLAGLSPRGQILGMALVLMPKAAGPLLGLLALQRLLPRSLAAAVVAEVWLILPYIVLVLLLHLRAIPSRWWGVASGLGATPWQAFWRVRIPMALPGLLLAGQLALIWGLGGFLGPVFLGTPDETTLSVEVHRQAFEYNRWPRAAGVAVVLAALMGIVLLLTNRILAFPGLGRRARIRA